ncbi:MAG: hypothetical protein ACR5K7_01235 [Symbiopectobacterium sp.]
MNCIRNITLPFIKHWKETTGETLAIKNSHGGFRKQTHSVIDGLQANAGVRPLAFSGGDIDVMNLN